MNIKIIVGANFGDEGKGLMTDYFASKAKENCIVIKSNGGSQAGHTVVTPLIKHVFHHFGSGTFANAHTYLSENFIVNPIIFHREIEELKKLNNKINPICFVNKNCLVTTPYDMIVNQILENNRKKDRHGSCGLGIYETILRNNIKLYNVESFNRNFNELKDILNEIKDNYIPKRLNELKINNISKEMKELLENENMINNFIDDLRYFYDNIIISDDTIASKYNTILFECGQGLLLDKDNKSYFPHLTPSNTGIKNPIKIIKSLIKDNVKSNINIEICYVTRAYMTRHGAGKFNTECDENIIKEDILDLTNNCNIFQGRLRYGFFDFDLIINSINNDLKNYDIDIDYSLSLSVTHLDETNNFIKCKCKDINIDSLLWENFKSNGLTFDKYYTSNGELKHCIIENNIYY